MAFTNNALENSTSSFTITAIATTAASGVVTTNTAGLISKVETGAAGTLFVGTATVPKFLAAGTTGYILISAGAAADPVWTIGSSISLGATQYAVQVGGAAGVISSLASNGSAGQILTSGGASANPGWTTSTYPSSVATGDILSATNTNTIGVIAGTTATNNYILTANGSGVAPTWQANNASGLNLGYLFINVVGPTTLAANMSYEVRDAPGSNYSNVTLPATGNSGNMIIIFGRHWNVTNMFPSAPLGYQNRKLFYNSKSPNALGSVTFIWIDTWWQAISISGILA